MKIDAEERTAPSRIAALQVGSNRAGNAATIDDILAHEGAIIRDAPALIVMPEALLGGYPKGDTFGTQLGFRTSTGRDAFRRYFEGAVDIAGPEVASLVALAGRTRAAIVVGVIERAASTLYCTALFIDPEAGVVAKHRKLMPTGTERVVWGRGDGSTLPVVPTRAGMVGAAICWENYMPLLRTALYAKGVQVWCAPTVDTRDVWQSSMRHIATEGRCFVVSACQFQPSPDMLGVNVPNWPGHEPLMRGGSTIIGPLGDVLAGPLWDEPGLVCATIDLTDLVRARFDFDPVGHYARPDVFQLQVDERPRPGVVFEVSGPC